ncbi:MAG: AAA family ATPase [Paludibacteraceae bacterium]
MESSLQMYEIADKFAAQTKRNIFLTGKAGTGKTTFLQKLKEKTYKQMAVVAPTGVAAINAGGTTIHSFFQLPLMPFIPTIEGRKELISKLKMQRNQRRVIRELELLVIDEVSMVRADVMDAIDTVLRHIRYRPKEPFGGVQVIFIGDMYQLPPVMKDDEWRILSNYYEGIYFFHSKVIDEESLIYIEFDKIFRQSDMNFISLLNKIRNNVLDNDAFETMSRCYRPGFIAPQDSTYITLTTHNYKADRINQGELKKLETASYTYSAQVKGDFPERNFPVDLELTLKIGARVMFLKNDTEVPRRFYNGKIGKITAFGEDSITVECPGADVIDVSRMEWNNIRYSANEVTQQIDEEILGVFRQFPLRLAWAITIHKSQGLTFDKAVIDAEDAFASGQVYVALSRCRTLEGVVLTSPIHQFAVHNDDKIVAFSKQKNSLNELHTQLKKSENDFFTFLLLGIFDFRAIVTNVKNLIETIKQNELLQTKEVFDFSENLLRQSAELQDIAGNFSQQLLNICSQSPLNHTYLQQRLQAAEKYFTEKFSTFSEELKKSPASIDNKQIAKSYDDDLKEIFTLAEQKKHLIIGIKDHFSIQKYY